MIKYKDTVQTNGMLVKKAVVPYLDTTPSIDKKMKTRKEINENVFDLDDSVADNSKMISLLTTIISRMYDTFSDEQKDLMDSADREMIEYTFAKFKDTNTRADVQFATEGIGLVDKLLDRQGQIGTIVKDS